MYILHNVGRYEAQEISLRVVLREYLSVRKPSGDIVANVLCASQVGLASLGALNAQRGAPFLVPSRLPLFLRVKYGFQRPHAAFLGGRGGGSLLNTKHLFGTRDSRDLWAPIDHQMVPTERPTGA